MDYKERVENLMARDEEYIVPWEPCERGDYPAKTDRAFSAADAIKDLSTQLKAAEERAQAAAQALLRVQRIAQRAAKIPYRWFPGWAKGGEPDDRDD